MVLRQPCCPSNSCSTGRIFLAFPSPYSRTPMPWSWLVSRMYHACTTHVPGLYLPIPSQAPGLYLACTWLAGGFGWLWVALPRLSAFFILPSAFAPRWLWAALGCFASLDVGCSMLVVRCSP